MPFIHKSALFASLMFACTIACGGSGPSESKEGHLPGVSTSQFAASCGNGVKDNGETATDCGGPNCGACGTGAKCLLARDCLSLVCKVGYCAAPGVDGVQNGDESDVDCGGTWPSSAATGKCAIGKHCFSTNNCVAGSACVNFICAAPACSDGIKNGDETDVDCGGSCPNKCIDGKKCAVPGDCTGNLCSPSSPGGQPYCRDPNSCADGHMDNDETGVDCGGSCKPCAAGVACNSNIECSTGVCSNHVCQAASCSDGVKNGTETGVDCGGSGSCPRCGESGFCTATSDCQSGLSCVSGICQAADSGNLCLSTGSGPSYKPPVVCSPINGCVAGVCDPLNGQCAGSNLPNGTSCASSDPNGAGSGACSSGACAPTACNAGYTLTGSVCVLADSPAQDGCNSSGGVWNSNTSVCDCSQAADQGIWDSSGLQCVSGPNGTACDNSGGAWTNGSPGSCDCSPVDPGASWMGPPSGCVLTAAASGCESSGGVWNTSTSTCDCSPTGLGEVSFNTSLNQCVEGPDALACDNSNGSWSDGNPGSCDCSGISFATWMGPPNGCVVNAAEDACVNGYGGIWISSSNTCNCAGTMNEGTWNASTLSCVEGPDAVACAHTHGQWSDGPPATCDCSGLAYSTWEGAPNGCVVLPRGSGTYCGGNGTPTNPYLICSAAAFEEMLTSGDAAQKRIYNNSMTEALIYYKQTADFTLDSSWHPFELDSANYSGQNHTITYVDNEPGVDNRGLFSVLDWETQISGLHINATVSGRNNVGGLAGVIDGHGALAPGSDGPLPVGLTAIHVTGTVSAYTNAGGMVGTVISGDAYGGEIGTYNRVSSSATVTQTATGDDASTGSAGGLVGSTTGYLYIQNCAASGSVTASGGSAGGIVGIGHPDLTCNGVCRGVSILYCISTASLNFVNSIDPALPLNALIGVTDGDQSNFKNIEDVYPTDAPWCDATGCANGFPYDGYLTTGLTGAELQSQANYPADWNFSSVWYPPTGGGVATLR